MLRAGLVRAPRSACRLWGQAGPSSGVLRGSPVLWSPSERSRRGVSGAATGAGLAAGLPFPVPPPPALPSLPVPPVDYAALAGKLPGTWDSMWPFANLLGAGMDSVHASMGLEWWAVIGLGALGLRLLTIPVSIASQRMAAKMHNIKPELTEVAERLKAGQRTGDYMMVQEAQMDQQDLFKKSGVKMGIQLLTVGLQGTIFMTFFCCLRMFARGPIEGFTSEGALWFTDLTAKMPSDPLGTLLPFADGMVLPMLNGALIWGTLKTNADSFEAVSPRDKTIKFLFLNGAPFMVAAASTWMPVGVVEYWVVSNTVGIAIALLLRTPVSQRFFNIPARIQHDEEPKAVDPDQPQTRNPVKLAFYAYKKWRSDKAPVSATIGSLRKQDDKELGDNPKARLTSGRLRPLHLSREDLGAAAAAASPVPVGRARPRLDARAIQAQLEKKRRASQW